MRFDVSAIAVCRALKCRDLHNVVAQVILANTSVLWKMSRTVDLFMSIECKVAVCSLSENYAKLRQGLRIRGKGARELRRKIGRERIVFRFHVLSDFVSTSVLYALGKVGERRSGQNGDCMAL